MSNTIVLVDAQALDNSQQGRFDDHEGGYLSRTCIKNLDFIWELQSQAIFSPITTPLLEVFELVASCQPAFHLRKGNLGHLSTEVLRSQVFCLSALEE